MSFTPVRRGERPGSQHIQELQDAVRALQAGPNGSTTIVWLQEPLDIPSMHYFSADPADHDSFADGQGVLDLATEAPSVPANATAVYVSFQAKDTGSGAAPGFCLATLGPAASRYQISVYLNGVPDNQWRSWSGLVEVRNREIHYEVFASGLGATMDLDLNIWGYTTG